MGTRKISYIVRGVADDGSRFTAPIGEIKDQSGFVEIVLDKSYNAVGAAVSGFPGMFVDSFSNITAPIPSDRDTLFNSFKLAINLDCTDKVEVRALKSVLYEMVARWAEKCRNKGYRGFRVSIIKTPIYDYGFLQTTVRFDVLVSTLAVYSSTACKVVPLHYSAFHEDLNSLHRELKKVLEYMSMKATVNGNIDLEFF